MQIEMKSVPSSILEDLFLQPGQLYAISRNVRSEEYKKFRTKIKNRMEFSISSLCLIDDNNQNLAPIKYYEPFIILQKEKCSENYYKLKILSAGVIGHWFIREKNFSFYYNIYMMQVKIDE